ncbi:mechanosensitive ion channel family protein [Phaeodactylibacter luteus]|uniref:Mechanosensitive ion channel n=1 Tax=Phaeodactylibacter luteus TaxID=1564516 RepID=A0A5C6RNS4_9BACT|nr:mechanosensitive ion channel family protein [Phaeodactylibacter luteus]TXB63280.1 mechanosensitive ion channel [Phaeodactylibacter luteus]
MTQQIAIYIITVLAGGGLTLWATLTVISRYKQRKIRRISELDEFNAVNTELPPTDPSEATLQQAADNISGRFSIIRKGAIVLITLAFLLLALVPFHKVLPLTSISVLISAFGIVLGIAARPVIENFISGILLSFSSNIRLGDTVVIDGQYGTVEDISFLHTCVKTWDWKRYIIANSDMIRREVINFTAKDNLIWAHVEFFVAPAEDLQEIRRIALDAARQHTAPGITEAPRFWVMAMQEQSTKCWVAAWANSPAEAWELQHNLRTTLTLALRKKGIAPHLNHHQLASSATVPS